MKKYLLPLLLLTALHHSKAQPTQLKFDHLSVKEGLPDQQVLFMKQDELGYLWIGTANGMVRYDGYKLKACRLDKRNTNVFARGIITDVYHNLWFSSYWGLYRYNRNDDSFTHYAYPYSKKPGEKNIGDLQFQCADSKGNLWGLSYNTFYKVLQVVKFNVKDKQFSFFWNKKSFSSFSTLPQVTSPVNSTGPGIAIGNNTGLNVFNYKANTFYQFLPVKDTSKQKSVVEIYEAPSEPGILWMNVIDHFSKQLLIERLDTRNKTFKDYDYGLKPGVTATNYMINDIYEDKQHRLWFAKYNGLMLFNRQTGTFTAFTATDTDKEADKNLIYGIKEAKNGTLWLNCVKGLLNFDPETHLFRRYTANPNDPYALSWNIVNNLIFDRSGILWATTTNFGVDKVNPVTSAFYYLPAIVRDGSAYTLGITNNITVSADGYCLFTNNRGVFKWKPGSGIVSKIYSTKKADSALDAIATGKDGRIYFSNGNGLQIYDPADHRLQSYSFKKNDSSSISGNGINIIMQDHTGLVWVGTETKGICSFDPATHKFTRYPYAFSISNYSYSVVDGNQLDDKTVVSIYEDTQGTVWVGTNLGGLNRFDRKTGKFSSFHFYRTTSVHGADHIFEDKNGRLWVGTYSQGLFEFDRKTGHFTRTVNEDNGLLCNIVTGLTQDNTGFLWAGSARGLTRVDPKSLTVKTFPVSTILPGKNIGDDYTLAKVNDLIVLLLKDGISSFDPRDLDGNPYPPQVHIEKVGYSNPASAADIVTTRFTYGIGQLELPYNQNRITFNYVALHFTNPAQNRYAYQLEGYDNHWIQAATQRSATYTNLTPGTYIFRVKACNSDGVWNNKGDSFMIIINAPWWQRWWAWLIYIILFASAIYAFVAYRSRKLRRENQLLEEKVGLRTKQLSKANKELSEQQEEITTQRDRLSETVTNLKATQTQLIQSEKMASLGELTAGIAHEIQNPLNFVNNFSEVNTELIEEMQQEIDNGNYEDVKAIAIDIKENLEKINHHGKRADFIVKGMLQHSRTGSAERQLTNINILAGEFFKLSFQGLRAKDKSFNAEMVTQFDKTIPEINIVQQDIGRVLLNLFNNAFYAVNQKKKSTGADYKPEVSVTTALQPPTAGGGARSVLITVKDNGIGIPDTIKEKIMQPFFTTKPTGEGTGLGLSLTYDMVVKGHGGTIHVNSMEAEGSEFIISLPL